MASAPIPAATLILVQERVEGQPELLMVERSSTMAFAPGALVFPGGRIDPGDVALSAAIGLEDGGARHAAIRETIEECGLAAGLDPACAPEQLLELQQALLSGAEFGPLLEQHGLAVRTEALTLFARWVPGHRTSRTFDTLFFMAKAPAETPAPQVGSSECVSAMWISASEALDQGRRGAVKLIYPTLKNLERLAQFESFEAMRADAERHPVVPVIAASEWEGDDEYLTIPEGLGYPITRNLAREVSRG
jgi:8-oxo-dGTP pyrophosphatase MutT (NUDIX family)